MDDSELLIDGERARVALANAINRLKRHTHGEIVYGSLAAQDRDIIIVVAALDVCGKELVVADAALAASEARVAALHTDHEYDVEKVLWRLLVANQQYILALAEGNANLAGVWLNRLKVFQKLWLKDSKWYMQHPKWDTANDDIIGDITGQPGGNVATPDGEGSQA